LYRLYSLLLYLFAPWVVLRLLLRGLRNPAYWRRIPERIGFVRKLDASDVIWIHAVSVGEVRAADPLLRVLAQRFPKDRLLVTTMTPTGSATVDQLFGDRVAHCYVPYDFPSAVRRFLDRTHPKLALVMETELWPNLFRLCRSRFIPVVVANVRMSESSMRKYRRFSGFTRSTLQQVDTFAAQTEADADRLRRLGADPESVHVTGSIKFELSLPAGLRESAAALRRDLGPARPVWLAASTHEGEEEVVLAAARALKARMPDGLLVLVPRHPERFVYAARLSRRLGFKSARRSELQGPLDAEIEVLIGDTMGELQIFYGAVDVAFIGGSLVPTGGHNLLEAAAVGTPVVFGPHMFNFEEIGAMARERGAGVQIKSADDLAPAIFDFLENAQRRLEAGEAGKKMVEENRGALDKILQLLDRFIGPRLSL
jgi:3-deoxy-D-manno-octulosonic-acid transferase